MELVTNIPDITITEVAEYYLKESTIYYKESPEGIYLGGHDKTHCNCFTTLMRCFQRFGVIIKETPEELHNNTLFIPAKQPFFTICVQSLREMMETKSADIEYNKELEREGLL